MDGVATDERIGEQPAVLNPECPLEQHLTHFDGERINELDQTGAQLSVVASEHGIVLYQETEMVN